MFQGNLKEVLREFEKSFHGVSIISDDVSKVFKGYFKEVNQVS